MYHYSLYILLLLINTSESVHHNQFAVAAYLPEWRYEGANWNTIAKHTTHLILFSLEISKNGDITALDRFPRPKLYKEARIATKKHNCKLLICFGGNGRSDGYSSMTRSKTARRNFISNLQQFLIQHDLDGVDYNWEYPGYKMGQGYLSEPEINLDYIGLLDLLKETRETLGEEATITLSYYPDGKQESLLIERQATQYVDLLHAMAYDHHGQHSTMAHFVTATQQATTIFKEEQFKVTIGLPFYGRNTKNGDWISYEDLVTKHDLLPESNQMGDQYYNGVDMIRKKVRHAMEHEVGGVMIWEVGQDCRVVETVHGDTDIHVKTCQEKDSKDSLLLAITDELIELRKTQQKQEEL